MYKKAFNRFFWGFFFAMFSFRIKNIDIIPDVIGYILIYQGLSILEDKGENFREAKRSALPMILLSIYTIYDFQPFGDLEFIKFGFPEVIAIVIGILIISINLDLIYHLFMGVRDLALEKELSVIANAAEKNWNNYKALIIATIVAFVLIIFPPVAILMLLGVVIGSLVIMIQIMIFMKKAGEELQA